MAQAHDGAVTAEESAQHGQEALIGGTATTTGTPASRAEAYRMLLCAASYLRDIEPHSPTPYLVMKAVSWGDMSLDELLRQFVSEGLNFEALFTFLGIEPPEER